MMRSWKTVLDYSSGADLNRSVGTCYKTYRLKEIGDIIRDSRQSRVQQNLPKRKLNPISAYVLDHLIDQFFSAEDKDDAILEKITIEDSKENGL